MTLTRRHFLALTAAATALPCATRASATETLGGSAFGSYWRALVPVGTPEAALRRSVAAIVADVDAALSPYVAGSALSRFNRGETVRLPDSALPPARAALALAAQTDGVFDPTVGPLVARYGFGPIHGPAGDWRALDLSGNSLHRAADGPTLDLCGIAKGHALDRMAEAWAAQGITDFVLELGGEVAVRGQHPEGRDWQVGIETGMGGLAGLATLSGLSIATSGQSAQSYRIGASEYGHIIDPATGLPASGSLASVSVIHENAMWADGLATALFAMGADRARRYAETHALATALTTRDGTTILTGAARTLVQLGNQPA